jgi:hypothetical protein
MRVPPCCYVTGRWKNGIMETVHTVCPLKRSSSLGELKVLWGAILCEYLETDQLCAKLKRQGVDGRACDFTALSVRIGCDKEYQASFLPQWDVRVCVVWGGWGGLCLTPMSILDICAVLGYYPWRWWAGIAQSVRGSNPGGGEIFRPHPDRPRGPPSYTSTPPLGLRGLF